MASYLDHAVLASLFPGYPADLVPQPSLPAPVFRTVKHATLNVEGTLNDDANADHFRGPDEKKSAARWKLYLMNSSTARDASLEVSVPPEGVNSQTKAMSKVALRLLVNLEFDSPAGPDDAYYEYTLHIMKLECEFLFQFAKKKAADVLTPSMSVRSLVRQGGDELANVQVVGLPTSIHCMSQRSGRRLANTSDWSPPPKRQRRTRSTARATIADAAPDATATNAASAAAPSAVPAPVPAPVLAPVFGSAPLSIPGSAPATVTDHLRATVSYAADGPVRGYRPDDLVEVVRAYLREGGRKAAEIIDLLDCMHPLARDHRVRLLESLLFTADRIVTWSVDKFGRVLGLLCAGNDESVWSDKSHMLMHLVAKHCHNPRKLEYVFQAHATGSTATLHERNAQLDALRFQASGFTPVHAAARQCNTAFLVHVARIDPLALLQLSEDDQGTFLHSLVNVSNSRAVLDALEDVIAEPMWATLLETRNKKGRTPHVLVKFQVEVRCCDELRKTVEWIRAMEARVVGTSLSGEGAVQAGM
ncbi:hypothetical protein GGF31_002544 [Allomyces arbusculus]|nr:hypothetical protein GGF31_002544 [Allomyces arbusculus]